MYFVQLFNATVIFFIEFQELDGSQAELLSRIQGLKEVHFETAFPFQAIMYCKIKCMPLTHIILSFLFRRGVFMKIVTNFQFFVGLLYIAIARSNYTSFSFISYFTIQNQSNFSSFSFISYIITFLGVDISSVLSTQQLLMKAFQLMLVPVYRYFIGLCRRYKDGG